MFRDLINQIDEAEVVNEGPSHVSEEGFVFYAPADSESEVGIIETTAGDYVGDFIVNEDSVSVYIDEDLYFFDDVEDLGESLDYIKEDLDDLSEAIIKKVNHKGRVKKRVKCRKGYKLNSAGTSCVPITGKEKTTKRKASVKAVRTKKKGGQSLKNRTSRLAKRAKKKRKSMGL